MRCWPSGSFACCGVRSCTDLFPVSSTMFKWICLLVIVVFLSVLVWMVNDLRLQVRQSLGSVDSAAHTVNDNLPSIVERTRKTADTLGDQLPEIVERIQKTTEVVAELSEDINQIKEL